MSEKFGLVKLESVEDRYLSGRTVMDCSDLTAAEIDKEVMRLMSECYDEAKRLLSENKELVDELATFLLEKESITGKEFMEIYNRAKGITVSDDTDSSENSEENVDEFGPMEDSLQVDDLKKLDGVDI